MVVVGEFAPDFEVNDSFGKKVKLSDFRGKNIALYFYPRDGTPGCTIEACNFRDDFGAFKKNGIVVLGVSMDGMESHKKFAKKFGLPFPLLADTNGAVSKKFGAFGEKNFFGRKIKGVQRKTFLIGRNGKILHVFETVDVKVHSREILELFKAIGK